MGLIKNLNDLSKDDMSVAGGKGASLGEMIKAGINVPPGFVVLGVIAMLTNTPFLLIPIGIIFIIESGSVIVQLTSKKLRGKKIFISTPIHHHFEALGWHETRVTMRFWMISAIGAIIGLIIFLVDSKIPPLFR